MKKSILLLCVIILFASCASGGSVGGFGGGSAAGLSLMDAIKQSAEKIADELPAGSRVAIVAFESPNDNLSDYIMEELTGALIDCHIEVADRQNLEYVFRELNFQMSGNVSDESAQSIGKFLGAQLVITGQLTDTGAAYRLRTSAVHVEKATRISVPRFDVRNDQAMQRMVTALANQKTTTKTARYGVSEHTAPKTAGTFLDRGIMFAMRREYEPAIADFTEALRLDANMTGAYLLRGRALVASALQVTAVEGNFSSVTTTATGGRATTEQARILNQAIGDFTQALRLDPNNAATYIERGRAYSDMGNTDQGIADYTQAIRLVPNDAAAYNGRGTAYLNKNDYDRAITDFNQAIRLDPNDAIAYNSRGVAYYYKNDYDRAITDYNQAIRLDPNYASAYYNRGIAYYYKNDYDRAIADYNQAIRLDPNDAYAYRNRGDAYRNKNDYDRAIADYTQAIRLDPNYAIAYYNRGNAYRNKNDYDRAIADYEAALRIEPNNAYARQRLNETRQARGR